MADDTSKNPSGESPVPPNHGEDPQARPNAMNRDQPHAVHRTGEPPVDPEVATAEAPGSDGNGDGVPLDDQGQPLEEPDRLAAPVGNEEPPRLPFVVVGV